MKVKIYDLNKKPVGEAALDKDLFGLEARPDIVKRVVEWQLAKRMSGTHSTKTVSEVSGTTKKPFRQKGTGNARQGSLRSVHMRGGGVSHGPKDRSHEFSLPKKVRRLGLIHALSAKQAEGKLVVLSNIDMKEPKTSVLSKGLNNFGGKSYFIIDGEKVNDNLAKASSNVAGIVVVPQIGTNVYDIIKHDYLVITEAGLGALEKRLKNA